MELTAKGVTAGYGGEPVITAVDLSANPGELVAVVGPNGSGKTTLLRALAGTLPMTEGEVSVGGTSMRGMPARERAMRIAVVPQSSPFEFAFSVREVVEMGRTSRLTALGSLTEADTKAVDRALARTGVTELAATNSTAISSGQAQLVVLARALAQETKVLLLDEPTAHLDVAHQIEVMECVRRLVKEEGIAAVAVLHDLNLAATYADRITLLSKGRVRAEGTPAQVLTRSNVAATFGLDVLVRRHPVTGAFFVVPLALSSSDPAPSAGAGPRKRVHLVCGGGTGAPLMHALVRAGFDVSVGVINVLDSDFEVAEGLGLRVVAEAPFSAIAPASLDEARALAKQADALVMAPVPVGRSNEANLELLEGALSADRPVLLVGLDGLASRDFTGGTATARISKMRDAGEKSGRVKVCATVEAAVAALQEQAPPASR